MDATVSSWYSIVRDLECRAVAEGLESCEEAGTET
jgi:hypothetical protein